VSARMRPFFVSFDGSRSIRLLIAEFDRLSHDP
jgi:hypothetical protein